MKKTFQLLIQASFGLLVHQAHAQFTNAGFNANANFGTGMYGGNQPCNQQMGSSRAVYSEENDLADIRADKKETKERIRDLQKDIDRLNDDVGKFKKVVIAYGSVPADQFKEVVDSIKICAHDSNYVYPGRIVENEPLADAIERMPAGADSPAPSPARAPAPPPQVTETRTTRVQVTTSSTVTCPNPFPCERGSKDQARCEEALESWMKKQPKLTKLEDELRKLENELSRLDDNESDAKTALRDRNREIEKISRQGGCVECYLSGRGTSSSRLSGGGGSGQNTFLGMTGGQLAGTIANVGLGLLAIRQGSQVNRTISDNNARNGFYTEPVSSFGFGYPFFANALYGATNGGGVTNGGFACTGSVGGGGFTNGPAGMFNQNGLGSYNGSVFGYPQSFAGTPGGGGIFNPGFSIGSVGNFNGNYANGNSFNLNGFGSQQDMYRRMADANYAQNMTNIGLNQELNSVLTRMQYGGGGSGQFYSGSQYVGSGAGSFYPSPVYGSGAGISAGFNFGACSGIACNNSNGGYLSPASTLIPGTSTQSFR